MKLLYKAKDGGPESNVTGYWLIEWKRVFSIALLRFSHGTRESFHSHAFNSISWLLKGCLQEQFLAEQPPYPDFVHYASLRPIITRRNNFHRVKSWGTSWVLTFRGPWSKTWREFDPAQGVHKILESGRNVRTLYCLKPVKPQQIMPIFYIKNQNENTTNSQESPNVPHPEGSSNACPSVPENLGQVPAPVQPSKAPDRRC